MSGDDSTAAASERRRRRASGPRTIDARRCFILSEARCTQYLPATFGMSWEKIGVLKPDRIHKSGDTTKIPAAEATCADLYARTARGEAPASLRAHALFGTRTLPATRKPSTAHSCVKGKGGHLPALCLPQADVVEEDCARKLGHVGVFGVERAVNATARVHGMQPVPTRNRGGARPSGMPGMRQRWRRICKCAEGSGKGVPFCRGAAPAHLSLVEGMWSQRTR